MIEPESPESGCETDSRPRLNLQAAEELSFRNALGRKDGIILKSKSPLQQCTVCSRDTHSNYYGAICCDPCQTFFRRHTLTHKVRFYYTGTCSDNSFCLPVICVQKERKLCDNYC